MLLGCKIRAQDSRRTAHLKIGMRNLHNTQRGSLVFSLKMFRAALNFTLQIPFTYSCQVFKVARVKTG